MKDAQEIQVREIDPIHSVDTLKKRLKEMATPLEIQEDPMLYFGPRIAQIDSFALGPYIWCVVDFADQGLYEIGGMTEEITGKPYAYWKRAQIGQYLFELAHPDHIPHWMGYIQFVYAFLLQNPNRSAHRSLFPHVYLQMKSPQGNYRQRVMQFLDWRVESNGGVRYCLCLITDIEHLQLDLKGPEMVVLEIVNGKTKLIRSKNIHAAPQQLENIPRLSKREIEVLRLMASGQTSKLIADTLGIAKNTVENHRQKMLRKTNCFTSAELIKYAIHHGWI
jgi:DNA-binding CsgD family transcriptional regulator